MSSRMCRSNLVHIVTYLALTALLCRPLLAWPPCPGVFQDCDEYQDDVVWSRNAQQQKCIPVKNRCFFNTVNCYYYIRGFPLLEEVSQEQCQRLCQTKCRRANGWQKPICASRGVKHNDHVAMYYKNFKSTCRLANYICNTGRVWTIEPNDEPCKHTRRRKN